MKAQSVAEQMWGNNDARTGDRSIFSEAREARYFSLEFISDAPPEVIILKLGKALCDTLEHDGSDEAANQYLRWLLAYIEDLERFSSHYIEEERCSRYDAAQRKRSAKIVEIFWTPGIVEALCNRPKTAQTALVELARQMSKTPNEEEADGIFAWFVQWSRLLEKTPASREVYRCAFNVYFPFDRATRYMRQLKNRMRADDAPSQTLYDQFARCLGATLCHQNESPAILSLLQAIDGLSEKEIGYIAGTIKDDRRTK